MAKDQKSIGSSRDVQQFLKTVAVTPLKHKPAAGSIGRLLFGMDATASRESTWDNAMHIQSEMFQQAAAIGSLQVQLCYYRGFREFYASPWLRDSQQLLQQMTGVFCLGGHTQITRLLRHCLSESRQEKIQAVVFVGDCMEDPVDSVCEAAGELGLLGVPVFMFQEGHDVHAEHVFRQIAKLTQGAWCRFDSGSAAQLKALLGAVAVFATGGKQALLEHGKTSDKLVMQLLQQFK